MVWHGQKITSKLRTPAFTSRRSSYLWQGTSTLRLYIRKSGHIKTRDRLLFRGSLDRPRELDSHGFISSTRTFPTVLKREHCLSVASHTFDSLNLLNQAQLPDLEFAAIHRPTMQEQARHHQSKLELRPQNDNQISHIYQNRRHVFEYRK